MIRDDDLVARCQNGDDAAWMKLIRLRTREVYRFCLHFTGREEEAEDATQEIFLKVFRTIESYDPGQSSFSTWVNRVARNHLVDHYRRTRMDRVTSSLEEAMPRLREDRSEEQVIGQLELRERREALETALKRLPAGLREAVILRDLEGLEYTEIACVLRVSLGAVKSRIHRGRLELGRLLGGQRDQTVLAAPASSF
jgi:RNA polymerase sigma-70 factor, ECF subfamily